MTENIYFIHSKIRSLFLDPILSISSLYLDKISKDYIQHPRADAKPIPNQNYESAIAF